MRAFYLTIVFVLCNSLKNASAFTTKGLDVIRGHHRPSGGWIAGTYSAHSADSVDAASVKNDVTNTQLYDYQIKKAKKIHVKDISRLCVDTFLGEGDDWLHINREKQRVARDITNRWSK